MLMFLLLFNKKMININVILQYVVWYVLGASSKIFHNF